MTTTVKIRRVGNSNVISLPRGLERHGYKEGTSVAIVPLRTGEILLFPADKLDPYIDQLAERQIEQHRESLQKPAAYDAAGGDEAAAN